MVNRQEGQIRIGQSIPNLAIQKHKHSKDKHKDNHKDNHKDRHSSKYKYTKEKKSVTITSTKEIDKFNMLVEKNKASGKDWFHGLEGDWWWGMSEDEARRKIMEVEQAFKSGQKIAIASIIRNEESNGNLKGFLKCCQGLEQYHDNIFYIFIEGDSSDNTFKILKGWLIHKKDYILKKLDRAHPPFPKTRDQRRTTYFAELRNMLIDLALSVPDISEVLMIDANYGWGDDLISLLRQTDADIAAPLAVTHKNHDGKYIFYDIWAFRKDGREFSPFYPYCKGFDSDDPSNIDSAGGGYLIRRKVLDSGVRYDGKRDCEHVSFCQGAKKKGFTVKIDPRVCIRKGKFEKFDE